MLCWSPGRGRTGMEVTGPPVRQSLIGGLRGRIGAVFDRIRTTDPSRGVAPPALQVLTDKTAANYRTAFLNELSASWDNDYTDNHDWANLGKTEPPPPVSGEYLYGLLGDERSRELLVKLMAYRLLGHRKVKLPRNTPRHWRDIEDV